MPSRRSEPIARADVVRVARSFVGLPFVFQGRDRRRGVDCLGLVAAVTRELGVEQFWDEPVYRRVPSVEHVEQIAAGFARHCVRRTGGFPLSGDVALIAGRRYINHIAIVADGGDPFSLIHADRTWGRVIEHRADDDWIRRIRALYRLPGVTE